MKRQMEKIKFFKLNISAVEGVSIGHAVICDAIYFGFENAIQLYKRQIM